MITHYRWAGGEEAALTFGEAGWPTLLVLPPLFEEANRTRHALVSAMRSLASDHGVASWLPDLPGTGESLRPTVDARWDDWKDAVRAAAIASGAACTLAVRGGALLAHASGIDTYWQLAPESGERLLRAMVRASAISAGIRASLLEAQVRAAPTLLGGNLLHPDLAAALAVATYREGENIRTLRLEDAPQQEPAPIAIWHRSELVDDPHLAPLIVSDVLNWMRACDII